jgi:Tol biopolymer transport system component
MPHLQSSSTSLRTRVIAFAAIAAACILGGAGYVAIAALSGDAVTTEAHVAAVRTGAAAPPSLQGRRVLVRAVDQEEPGLNGRVTAARLGGGVPRVTALECQRVDMAAGRGICLTLTPAALDYSAVVFDESFRPVHSVGIDGLPSRARVSPDGRLGAVTSFVTGHSYAQAGAFSTSTQLLDLRRGRWIGNLEDFEVMHRGRRIESPDFNFWGVTFKRGGDVFYATLSTGEHRYLVRGDISERRVEVLRDRVECPSLSPNGHRIAYKRTLGGGRWRLHVLDLRSGEERALAETRSIDDQVEWLDNRFVLYGDGRDVFVTAADGRRKPDRVLANAASPAALE